MLLLRKRAPELPTLHYPRCFVKHRAGCLGVIKHCAGCLGPCLLVWYMCNINKHPKLTMVIQFIKQDQATCHM